MAGRKRLLAVRRGCPAGEANSGLDSIRQRNVFMGGRNDVVMGWRNEKRPRRGARGMGGEMEPHLPTMRNCGPEPATTRIFFPSPAADAGGSPASASTALWVHLRVGAAFGPTNLAGLTVGGALRPDWLAQVIRRGIKPLPQWRRQLGDAPESLAETAKETDADHSSFAIPVNKIKQYLLEYLQTVPKI